MPSPLDDETRRLLEAIPLERDPDRLVVLAGALAWRAAHPEVFAPLLALSQHESESVRASAVRGVASAWDRGSLIAANQQAARQRLVDALDDPDPDVRFEAARVAGGIEEAQAAAGEVLWQLLSEVETPPAMIPSLLRGLSRCQLTAAQAVRVLELADHDRDDVREAAAAALGAVSEDCAAVEPALCQLLDDDDPFVREEAARSLGKFPELADTSVNALASAVEDEDEAVAQSARESLKRHRPPA